MDMKWILLAVGGYLLYNYFQNQQPHAAAGGGVSPGANGPGANTQPGMPGAPVGTTPSPGGATGQPPGNTGSGGSGMPTQQQWAAQQAAAAQAAFNQAAAAYCAVNPGSMYREGTGDNRRVFDI